MTKHYKLEEIKVGNHLLFKRIGVDDFRMWWTVIGFSNEMIKIKIAEMGYEDEIYIELKDIESLQSINDKRFQKGN